MATPGNASPKKISLYRTLKYRIEYAFVLSMAWCLSRFDRTGALAAGRTLGTALYFILRSRLTVAQKNIEICFPGIPGERTRAIIRGCWENLGMGAGEFVAMPSFSREEVLAIGECEGLEHLRDSSAKGKGALIVTGHFGAWELGARFWPEQGFKTAVVARRIKNPFVDEWVTRIRSAGGVKVIPAREAVRESVRWLKQGNLLAILIDHRVTEGGLKADFFGRPAFTTGLPAILALRYGIPVHPVHSWRENGKVRIKVAPAMDLSDLKSGEEGILEAVTRMNKVVENWVRERPEAWLWIHNRWKIS